MLLQRLSVLEVVKKCSLWDNWLDIVHCKTRYSYMWIENKYQGKMNYD